MKTATRLVGIDIARFLAIIGMMAAHLYVNHGAPEWVDTVTAGYPSALFAVLGGFGVTFASRSFRGGAAVVSILTRGVLVILIGKAMELLPDHNIAVVLTYFGTAIALSAVFVLAPTWVLIVAATLIALVSAQIIPWYRSQIYVEAHTGVIGFWQGIFLTGTYPALTWLAYLLIGMVLARFLLSRRSQGRMESAAAGVLVGGVFVAVLAKVASEIYLRQTVAPSFAGALGVDESTVADLFRQSQFGSPAKPGWIAVMIASPHSGSVMDIIHSSGVAAAVIGLCLLVTARLSRIPWVLRPIVSAGSAPLTIYTLHIVMTAFTFLALSQGASPTIQETALWWQLGVVLVVGVVLAVLGSRGPLEILVSAGAKKTAALVQRLGTDGENLQGA